MVGSDVTSIEASTTTPAKMVRNLPTGQPNGIFTPFDWQALTDLRTRRTRK
jgi:hypothetical protein